MEKTTLDVYQASNESQHDSFMLYLCRPLLLLGGTKVAGSNAHCKEIDTLQVHVDHMMIT